MTRTLHPHGEEAVEETVATVEVAMVAVDMATSHTQGISHMDQAIRKETEEATMEEDMEGRTLTTGDQRAKTGNRTTTNNGTLMLMISQIGLPRSRLSMLHPATHHLLSPLPTATQPQVRPCQPPTPMRTATSHSNNTPALMPPSM